MEKVNKATILIVDDKKANLVALENLLENKDRILITASSGKDALKTTLNKNIDLIILDVQMPDMDGFEVAQILKSNKKTRDIPIIFASAEKKEHKFMMKGYEEGAVDYLYKPLDPAIAKAKVSVLLQLQLQKKELFEKNISLERSALLINNSADIIGIIDAATFKIEEINEAFHSILGYEIDEAKEAALLFYLSDEDKVTVKELGTQKKDRLTFETLVHCKNGNHKWLQWNVVVKNGKWYVNARDITAIKLADEQIKQLNDELQNNVLELKNTNKELESFSYSVSHDLRAPLRALNGYSKIMDEDYSKVLDVEGKKLLDNIHYNANKMGMLVDDLLAFSRLGRKEVQKTPICLTEMLHAMVEELNRTSVINASIQIGDMPSLEADNALLYQVWMNLLSNAIKYSAKKKNPKIEIGALPSDNELIYYIKDNGAGFDMEYANKLFGVFQRLHSPSEFEGTGIGLAIVQRIITRHGGRVWAEGKVNEGATFYMAFPKNKANKVDAVPTLH